MKLHLLFAERYLRSPKSLSVINVISRVSIFAVAVPVAAMVILLSVFNGFEDLVKQMFNEFDPDIAITPAKGKVFETSRIDLKGLREMEGVDECSSILEESVLMEYRGRQALGVLRGVDSLYERVVPVRDLIVNGEYKLHFGDMEQAIVGRGIAYSLGIRTSFYNPLNVYAPRRGTFSSLLPMESYRSGRLFPAGVFALDVETDGTYVICPIDFARRLLNYPDRVSSLMVSLDKNCDPDEMRERIASFVGPDFDVRTRFQQKASMYRIMKYEKWGVFFITLLVLIIASFSIVGSLTMLIIEKSDDTRTLITLGADVRFVRRIFFSEGMLICGLGIVGGMTLGVLVCAVQQWFGIIKIGAQTFLVDSYPVVMRIGDLVGILVAAIIVSAIICKLTVSKTMPRTLIRL